MSSNPLTAKVAAPYARALFDFSVEQNIMHQITADFQNLETFLSETTNNMIFKSKGEARKMIQGGGVSINKSKISAPDQKVDHKLLQDKYLLAQKGKKNYYLIKVV